MIGLGRQLVNINCKSPSKQNLIFLMQRPENSFDISLKGGNMCMNRFCIDEDAAFEVSEIYFKSKFKRKSEKMKDKIKNFYIRKTNKIIGWEKRTIKIRLVTTWNHCF